MLLLLLSAEVSAAQDSFLADAVGDKHLQKVVGDLVKFVDALDVGADDRFFLFENSDRPVDLHVVQITAQGQVWEMDLLEVEIF